MSDKQLAESLERLYLRTAHGIKLGLDVENALLARLGNPHLRMAHVHVAGTNGKGSVCAMLDSILRKAGYSVGLYTSPHLVRFNERIRVDGQEIDDETLGELFAEVEAADRQLAGGAGSRESTFFEFTTALAFEYFRRRNVDVAVLETGMGGRLDATNVVSPLVSVITRIDVEHTAYLGSTIDKIAAEKAGIIKNGRAVICGAMPDEARDVVARVAGERGAQLIRVEDAVSVKRVKQDLHGQKLQIESAGAGSLTAKLPIIGKYQVENVALAMAAVDYLNSSSPFQLDEKAVKAGLESVSWPGRCQVLSDDPPILLDVAHNPGAARALAETLRELAGKKPVGLVIGVLSDKDAGGIFSAFRSLVKKCWVVTVKSERALPAERLLPHAAAAGMDAETASLRSALQSSREWAEKNNGFVCIAGSLFLAGEVLQDLRK